MPVRTRTATLICDTTCPKLGLLLLCTNLICSTRRYNTMHDMATLRDDYSTLHSNNYIAGTWCSSIGTILWRTNLENSGTAQVFFMHLGEACKMIDYYLD